MREQLDLLAGSPWDVLIILDACRADAFRGVCTARAETVRSPARRTDYWLRSKVGALFREREVVYFTANPVVARETANWRAIDRVDIWKTHWGRFGALNLPYVHPLVVNGVVGAWRDLGRLKACPERSRGSRPVVVHQLAPHSPYIGEPSYALTWFRQGIKGCEMAAASNRVCTYPPRTEIDWELLKRAYRGNLELAWQAARLMADQFAKDGRRVVITSDHGELLGESKNGGPVSDANPACFGHQGAFKNPLLYEIPWLEWERRGAEPTTQQKLEALGYA